MFWMILLGGWALLAFPFGFVVGTWMYSCERIGTPFPPAPNFSRPPYCIRCGRTHWDGECRR